jgi:hypothetical protein
VAVLVVAGAVVGVVVGLVPAGPAPAGLVPGEGVVVDADGGAPATLVEGEEPRVAEAPGSEPRARDADLVWNVRTPASPAMVAPITIGARLMNAVSSEWTWGFSGPTT